MKWKHCFLLKSVLRLCLSAQVLPRPSTKSNFGKSWYFWLTSTFPSFHRLSKRNNFVKSHPILFPGLSGQEGNPLYLFLTASLRKPDILIFTADQRIVDCWQAQEFLPVLPANVPMLYVAYRAKVKGQKGVTNLSAKQPATQVTFSSKPSAVCLINSSSCLLKICGIMMPINNSQAQLSLVISKLIFFRFRWDHRITFKLHLSYSSFFERMASD